MSELRQIAQHPEADTLSAFTENALPPQEREQMLQHLAVCDDCRAIVFLTQESAADELPAKPKRIAAVRRPWFSKAIFAWPIAAALAAVMAFTIYLRRPSSIRPGPALTNHASVQSPPPTSLQQVIPAPKDRPQSPAITPSTPPAVHGRDILGGLESAPVAPGTQLSTRQVESLPIAGRSIVDLPVQATNGISGSGSQTAATALGAGRGAPLGAAQDSVQAAAPSLRAAPSAVTLGAPLPPAIMAPSPPARSTSQAVEVSADAIELSTDAATVSSALVGSSAPAHLPSHLQAISMTSNGSQTLAIDTAGTLFRSTDSGRRWKQVHAAWSGPAAKVALLSSSKPPAASITMDGLQAQGAIAQYAAQAPPRTISAPTQAVPLQGTVTDVTGAAIPGATVSVTAASSITPRTVKTDAAGGFALHGLAPGVYRVQVEAPGFQVTQVQTTLSASLQASLNIKLPIGAESETVMVQSDSAAVSQDEKGSARRRRATEPPVFALTTGAGGVWISSDGVHWQPR